MTKMSWEELAGRSDEPAIQEFIRRAIRAGMIRVRPGTPGKIRITPRNDAGPPSRYRIPPLGYGDGPEGPVASLAALGAARQVDPA